MADSSKTEKPTGRRLQKEREKGHVARSREVPSATILLGVLLTLSYVTPKLLFSLSGHMSALLRVKVPAEITSPFLSRLMGDAIMRIGPVVGLIMLSAMVFALAANYAQIGWVVSWEALSFKFENLNPKNGFSRIFSKNGVVELAKSLLILVVVGYPAYSIMSEYRNLYPRLVLMDVRQLMFWTAAISYKVYLRIGILLFLLALADFAFQKYRFLEQLKMSKQEVKDEMKEMDGDPTTKGRIRKIQRDMARKRMMAEVPKADVVITNPTHYAVALSYKMDSMDAPRVVAKGVGFLALKIKELAQQHNIPMVENRPLAQTLYKTVEIGESIPGDLYRAVAEILAFIYRARNAWKS
jgi:flagellar biosynthesis protein FlhB